jgi:hypothetical protein
MNTNPIFWNNAPETDPYKNEVVKQLQKSSASELRFFTDKVVENGADQFLYVSIKSDSLCATGIFKIIEPQPTLDHLLKVKGMGYKSAELVNLKFDIEGNQLTLKSVDRIID